MNTFKLDPSPKHTPVRANITLHFGISPLPQKEQDLPSSIAKIRSLPPKKRFVCKSKFNTKTKNQSELLFFNGTLMNTS